MNLIDRINEHRDLYLTGIGEPEDNVLRLVIAEGRVSEDRVEAADDSLLGRLFANSRPIVHDERSATYEVVFSNYIAYAVLNESFTVWDESEQFEGKVFRIYSTSKFLSYVSAGTFASPDYPGPFRHYGIVCLNHVVHVASTAEPEIARVLPHS